MDSDELSEWYVLWKRIAPFGHESRQIARLTAMLINTNPFRSSDAPWIDEESLMPLAAKPKQPEPQPPQPPDEQIVLAKMVHQALGGR